MLSLRDCRASLAITGYWLRNGWKATKNNEKKVHHVEDLTRDERYGAHYEKHDRFGQHFQRKVIHLNDQSSQCDGHRINLPLDTFRAKANDPSCP
jgi:hypothetical protein